MIEGLINHLQKHAKLEDSIDVERFDATLNQIAQPGGTGAGLNLRTTGYAANNLNQYASRTVPGYANVYGTANAQATVSANDAPSERKGEYFWSEVPVNNTAAVTLPVTVRGVRFDGTHDVLATQDKTFTVPPAAQSFGYDSRGNLQGDGAWNYTWDAENRLVSMERPNTTKLLFDYDYLGRRVRKRVQAWVGGAYQTQGESQYVYQGWLVIAELNSSHNLRQFYLWGPAQNGVLSPADGIGKLEMLWDSVDQMQFVTDDAAGNVANLVWSDGTLVASYDYGPFGETFEALGGTAAKCPIRHANKYCDLETGLIYYGYRYYDPGTGRWLNRDPLGEMGGLNLYGFVRNNPQSFIDPSGLWDWSWTYSWTFPLIPQWFVQWSTTPSSKPPPAPMSKDSQLSLIQEELGGYDTTEMHTFADRAKVVVDLYPVAGFYNGAYAAIQGEDAVTFEGLSRGERISGGAGAAASALPFVVKGGKLLKDGVEICDEATLSAAKASARDSEVIAGEKLSHINGALGELHAWESALRKGHIPIQPPGKITAPGVDYATFDPVANEIVLWDSKYRGPGGSYPSSVPASKIQKWTQEVRQTVDEMPAGPMKERITEAMESGRFRAEIFRWPPGNVK